MYCGDQSNFVASNIKPSEFFDLVCVRENLTQLREIQKTASPHNRVPTRKRRFGVRVLFHEFIQAFPRNDTHNGGAMLLKTFPDEKPEEDIAECEFETRSFPQLARRLPWRLYLLCRSPRSLHCISAAPTALDR